MQRIDKEASLVRTVLMLSVMASSNVLAADGGPFGTTLNSFVQIFLDWATPLAIIGVIVVGLCALFGVLRPQVAIYAALGVVVVFGAPQLVIWLRSTGGV